MKTKSNVKAGGGTGHQSSEGSSNRNIVPGERDYYRQRSKEETLDAAKLAAQRQNRPGPSSIRTSDRGLQLARVG